MSNDPEGQARDAQVDEEMARADRTNGERTQVEPEPARSYGSDPGAPDSDPEAPGTYVDDRKTSSVAEPNEPA